MRNQRQTSGDSSLSQPNIHVHIHTYRVSQKKVWFAAPGAKNVPFLCNTHVCCFFIIFWKFVIFFATPMAQKKNPRTFYSHKIKSSEKQTCVNKLFLSKSKISKR